MLACFFGALGGLEFRVLGFWVVFVGLFFFGALGGLEFRVLGFWGVFVGLFLGLGGLEFRVLGFWVEVSACGFRIKAILGGSGSRSRLGGLRFRV